MKQRRRLSNFSRSRGALMMLLTITIVPYVLFSPCSCVVAVSVDRQASIRGQHLDDSNPIFDRRTTMMTANDFDVTASSPHRKDSQNYDEEQFFPFPSSRDLIATIKREELQRRLKKSRKRKRQPKSKYFKLAEIEYIDTGAKASKTPSSKSSKATASPAPSVSLAPSESSVPSSTPSESSSPSESSAPSLAIATPSQVPSLTPAKSFAPSKSSQPSQEPSTSTAPSMQPTTSIAPSTSPSKSGKTPKAAKAKF